MPIAWENGTVLQYPSMTNVQVYDDTSLIELQQHGIGGVGLGEGTPAGPPTQLTQYVTVGELEALVELLGAACVAAKKFSPGP